MMRKLWIMLALAALGCGAALAEQSGTCGEGLSWELSDDGVLNITGNGAMKDYLPHTLPWNAYRASIRSAV